MPLILLAPDTTLLCDTLLAESSGSTSPEDDGLALAREVGPLRLNDVDGVRLFCADERLMPGPDITAAHTTQVLEPLEDVHCRGYHALCLSEA